MARGVAARIQKFNFNEQAYHIISRREFTGDVLLCMSNFHGAFYELNELTVNRMRTLRSLPSPPSFNACVSYKRFIPHTCFDEVS